MSPELDVKELKLTHFSVSSSRNKLTVVGCNTLGAVGGSDSEGKNYTTGCVSLCYRLNDTNSGSCAGNDCRQIPIPGQGLAQVAYVPSGVFVNNSDMFAFTPCHYVFVVEDGAY